MFINGWSPRRCLDALQSLAQTAFPPWAMSTNPMVALLQRVALSTLAGSIYPATGIESALRESYGDGNLDDASLATLYGIKVAVPFTTIPGNAARLLTNYNGVGSRFDCGRPE
jgi:hypothetical protein